MKKLIFLFSVSIILLAGTVTAQVDPNPDGIGIYADLEATTTNITAAVGEPIEVYLLLTRPSCPLRVQAWECGIEAPSNVEMWGWTLPAESHSGIFFIDLPYYQAAFFESLPSTDIVVLMIFIVRVTDLEPAAFRVIPHWSDTGGFGLPCYLMDDHDLTPYPMHPYEPEAGKAAFLINGPTMAIESATWGKVKSLYQ